MAVATKKPNQSANSGSYDADDIEVLEGFGGGA